MSKQDRQGVRRASDLEQKYNLSLLNDLPDRTSTQDLHFSQLQQQVAQFMVNMNGKMAELESKLYPIGSFYISVNNTDPTDLFGGEWEYYADGHLVFGTDSETLPQILQLDDTVYVWKRIS